MVRRSKTIWLMVFVLAVIGCTPVGMMVKTNFINIDTADDNLEIKFSLGPPEKTDVIARITSVRVYNNDTLVVALSGAVAIDEFIYPSIPDGFEITYPENANSLPALDKNKNYQFVFSGEKNSSNFMYGNVTWGQWDYVAFYSKIEGRWLFDENGTFKNTVRADYRQCIGEDIIEVYVGDGLLVDDSTFCIVKETEEKVPYKYKIKRNPTDRIVLTVVKDQKAYEKIRLFIKCSAFRGSDFRSGCYEYQLEVPKYTGIRLSGKYSFLGR